MAETSSAQQQDRLRSCYLDWMVQQKEDLVELTKVFNHHPDDNEKLLLVTQTIMNHFIDYQGKRMEFALNDPQSFFSLSWCSSLEKSHFWIAGCRPTEFLHGVSNGNLGGLTASQLQMISELQGKTIKEEEFLSSRMASMQEDIADQPLALIAHGSSIVAELAVQVGQAIDEHASGFASILEDADNLRLNTLIELINILTPLQTVDFLLATKRLHLSMHEWGQTRDRQHGTI